MRRINKLGSAVALAAMIAGGMMIGTTRVEAKGKKGGDTQDAICSYLASVINYPYVSDAIKSSALYLFTAYNCDPALLN
jgi:hypothetical protein